MHYLTNIPSPFKEGFWIGSEVFLNLPQIFKRVRMPTLFLGFKTIPTVNGVITSTIKLKKFVKPNTMTPQIKTTASMENIVTFSGMRFFNKAAMRSGPEVEPPTRNIKPIPIPNKTAPLIAAMTICKEISCKFLVHGINKNEITVIANKVFMKKSLPFRIPPISRRIKLKI